MLSAKLIVSQPGESSWGVVLDGPAISVGRRPDNVVCLAGDSNVSKYHAIIERRGGALWITDLGSSNGTTINGEPLTGERRLRDGDLICVGGTSTLQLFIAGEHAGDAATGAAGQASTGFAAPPPSPNIAVPNVAVPNVAVPNVAAPNLALPNVAAPHVALPSVSAPNVSAPSVSAPNVSAPSPPGVSAPPFLQKLLALPRAAQAAAAGLLLTGGVLAALWGAGVVGGSAEKKAAPAESKDPLLAQIEASEKAAAREGEESAAESAPPVSNGVAPPAAAPPPQGAGDAATAALARMLAAQISQKSSYQFDPGFVALIQSHLDEYRAPGYQERAAKYREPIEREFVNSQGIPPIVAYVTAMSQTKFLEKGGSVWNLPPAALRGFAGEAGADPADPAASTRVAAAYMRSLLDAFDREDFMYAVACYGLTTDEAGKLSQALEREDPERRARGDFWKMKNAGVVQGPQVDRVARFFAAGIVGENPEQFGLKDKPLSSLY